MCAQEARASRTRTVQVFMQEALPEASETTRALAGDLITTTLSAVGKQFRKVLEPMPTPWPICFAPISEVSGLHVRALPGSCLGNRKSVSV
jgi:hypothetical protein